MHGDHVDYTKLSRNTNISCDFIPPAISIILIVTGTNAMDPAVAALYI
jgi:hypothetical protein